MAVARFALLFGDNRTCQRTASHLPSQILFGKDTNCFQRGELLLFPMFYGATGARDVCDLHLGTLCGKKRGE